MSGKPVKFLSIGQLKGANSIGKVVYLNQSVNSGKVFPVEKWIMLLIYRKCFS